jgi:hypothetical protein
VTKSLYWRRTTFSRYSLTSYALEITNGMHNNNYILLWFFLLSQFSCASRNSQTLYRGKHVKSLAVCQGKAYLGCTDLSIQVSFVVTKACDSISDHYM